MKSILLSLLSVLLLTQCKQHTYNLEDLPKEYIQIGSFGGFAGQVTTYFFFPNGQRFTGEGIGSGDGISESKEIQQGTPDNFKRMKSQLFENEFGKIKLNEIGNMTYFIRLKTKKTDHAVQWNNMDTAPKFLVEFYSNNTRSLKTEAIN